jgi:hypothetical protein
MLAKYRLNVGINFEIILMHNLERDDVAKEQLSPEDASAKRLFQAAEEMYLRLELRHPGKPIVCEVVGSQPVEIVVVVPGDEDSYTLQALRPLIEGEHITLKRRGSDRVVSGTLYHCRKAQRESDHANLHLAGLKVAPGAL